uniref:Uncharacterized protein n=1 Tax=Globodera rostochiensis TaxID=31243 RepID=A0A914H9U5_GLORO
MNPICSGEPQLLQSFFLWEKLPQTPMTRLAKWPSYVPQMATLETDVARWFRVLSVLPLIVAILPTARIGLPTNRPMAIF